MRAAIVQSPRHVEISNVPAPHPGPGQVRFRVEGCGVCASSLPVWQGRQWFSYPFEPGAPGHEAWGIIDEIGSNVADVQPGMRVGALSYRGFAEYDIAEASAIVRLPEQLNDSPFPAEALGCALNVFRRAAIEPGQRVAIVGIGFLGAVLTRLAHDAGADVVAISRRPFALDLARKFGAGATICADFTQPADFSSVAGDGFDCVIECAGLQSTLDVAGRLCRIRGRLVIAGYHQDGPRQVDMQQWNWKGLDVINAHERDERVYVAGMRNAVDLAVSGRLDVSALCTHSLSLEELPAAFRFLEERPDGFLKAVVRP